MTTTHEPQERYTGPAVLTVDGGEIAVEADLRGRFEPIDGHFHWYGRVAPSPAVTALAPGVTVTLTTVHGTATARLSDVDPWGRPRLSGRGAPPF